MPATYIQATPDLMMGDLLKNMRSSQIFSVCGLPGIKVHPVGAHGHAPLQYQVDLLGLDVFDPVTMDTLHRTGDDVPAWFLDTNYNGLCFHVSQAFFPRNNRPDMSSCNGGAKCTTACRTSSSDSRQIPQSI
jgi:adenine-specific DNA-methyltransferase